MSVSDWGIQAIPVITVIVFLIAEAVKATPLDNKWLPVICGATGGILGIVAMFLMPEFPAKDYLTAAAVGIVSGLAATGAHQIYKQLTAGSGGQHLEGNQPKDPEKDEDPEEAAPVSVDDLLGEEWD
jgi:hypothetical protein